MKKLSLSKFDLGYIIAFVVIGLLGGGAWWFLSGQLQDAQAAALAAKGNYDRYSSNTKYHVVVNSTNLKTLKNNIELLKSEIDPLVPTKLQPKDNKLHSVDKEDPVAWKHDLDDEVHRLTAAAKSHGVTLPPNFYFGFSRYLSQSPNDEQTMVLSKQLIGMEQLATILINAPVKQIEGIRRTYEEDPHTGSGGSSTQEPDHLRGYSYNVAANAYTVYPFELSFTTTAENLRPILDNLVQSPYIFVVRNLTIHNSAADSPHLSDLDGLAGAGAGGAPADPTAPPKGPQYLFGDKTLSVTARVDMIEWTAASSTAKK